jgi:type IV secretion system protein VirD4
MMVFNSGGSIDASIKGSARWATNAELMKRGFIKAKKSRPGKGALILGQPMEHAIRELGNRWFNNRWARRIDLPMELALKHLLILGPSGSGKGRGFYLYNLAAYNGSFITSDPKGEGYNLTSGYRNRVWRVAPLEPEESICFNWIPLARENPSLAVAMAKALLASSADGKQDFWLDAGVSFLSALFAHAATFDSPTPAAMYDFLTYKPKGSDLTYATLTNALLSSPNPYARQLISFFARADQKLQASIVIGVGIMLNWLADPKVRRFTSASIEPIDFGELRRKQIGVYYCVNERDVATLKPLSALFFTLALYQLKDRVTGIEEGKEQPVCLFLDELANIGRIPNLEVEVAVIRGRNIALALGLQSIAQLETVYGKAARVILDNCNTTIFLAGLKLESAEYVSRALGNRTIMQERVSETRGMGRTATYGREMVGRALLMPDEVRLIQEDTQIVITDNMPPIHSNRWWFDGEGCRKKTKGVGKELTIGELELKQLLEEGKDRDRDREGQRFKR